MSDTKTAECRRLATWEASLCFFEALAVAGVEHVCVSPGSRSTPLAVAARLLSAPPNASRSGALRTWVHLDERVASFFALGLAKASRTPVALVCTSGTAAANYLPAIIEARYAGVPLVVLTADRPPELRDRGAGQTIDQMGLYGGNVRWFHEVAVPEPGGPAPAYFRGLAVRAVAEAWGEPRGAVHLNWPLREPLDPPETLVEVVHAARAEGAAPAVLSGLRAPVAPTPASVDLLANFVRTAERGIITCGPNDLEDDLAPAVARLAELAGWPVLAEPTSGTRGGDGPLLARSELVLRDRGFAAAHAPDVVLRIGRSPTSKAQRLWLEAAPPRALLVVDADRAWNDASGLATHWVDASPVALLNAVCEAVGSPPRRSGAWLRDCLSADAEASEAIREVLGAAGSLLAPAVVETLAGALPEDAWLYVSNSMAVRDVDAFWPVEARPRRVLSNRGASGIDGVTSSALGAAAVSAGPLVLLTGDLAFLHDLGGLLAGTQHGVDATVVVLDDGGGGIFSHLPIAAHGEAVHFEELFRTPQAVDLGGAARSLGARYTRVEDAAALRAALAGYVGSGGLSIIAVEIDSEANWAQHRAIDAAIARRLSALSFELEPG